MAIWQPVEFNPMKSKLWAYIWSTPLITVHVLRVGAIHSETKQRLVTFGDGLATSYCLLCYVAVDLS